MQIKIATISKTVRIIFILESILFTAVLNLFYGKGEPLVQIWKLKITEDGIMTAVFMAIRIITLVVISSLLTYTTSPNELT